MLKYIIRLDDACPNMNKEKWDKIEEILDKYNIKPIVGIIPENKDKEFKYDIINFWETYAQKWQNKKWIIAQHGLNHNLSEVIRTEFAGKSYQEQKVTIDKGYQILKSNGLTPTCFFAPNHTYDDNTTKACKDLGYFEFISDGYAFYPYKENGMMFLPNVFDTPHKITNHGVYTFVYHPNNMTDKDYEYLENFILNHKKNFECDIGELLKKYQHRKRNIKDRILKVLINIHRKIKGVTR